MKTPSFQFGDKVKVRFATQDGYIYNDAIVVCADAKMTNVIYANGNQAVIPNISGRVSKR